MKNLNSRNITLFFTLLKHGFTKEFYSEKIQLRKHSDIFESEINMHNEK